MTRSCGAARRVLVLGSDTRSFLGVVRSLGRYGLSVDAAWVAPDAVARRSRHLKEIHDLPTPWDHPHDWLAAFNHLMQTQPYSLVVPCNDPSLIPLQDSKDQLAGREHIYLLEDQVFKVTQSKVLSTELAQSVGVNVPCHVVLENLEQAVAFADRVGYPLILKPAESFRSDSLRTKRNVVTINSQSTLESQLPGLLSGGRIQAQQYFQGVGTGVEFLAKEGRLQYAFQHLRVHEPLKGGGSSYRKSIALHPEMLEATRNIVAALHYSGVGMVEFRWNLQTDAWIFVEINGRFWGSLPLAIACGADFPRFLYQSRVEGRDDFQPGYHIGRYGRNWERDKNWLLEQRAVKRNLAEYGFSISRELLSGSCRTLLLREHADTFAWNDPAPFAAEINSILRETSSRIEIKARRLLHRSKPHRRIRHHQLRQQLRHVQSILFVCKGNICRSPFAAAYARRRLSDQIPVASAGYYPVRGRSSPSPAMQAAEQLGVSLAEHRSELLTAGLIEKATIVFVFDSENYEMIRRHFRPALHKTFFLNHIRLGGSLHIDDPYGGSVTRFTSTYQEIQAAIERMLAWIPSQFGTGR